MSAYRAVLSVLPAFVLCIAAPGSVVAMQDVLKREPPSAATPGDARDEALAQKKSGDQFAGRGDYAQAADAYLRALAAAPSAFTDAERLAMAAAISWAGRYDDAASILQAMLADQPGHTAARVQLAKVLSWAGKLSEAQAQADLVLKEQPGNRDALLVKANALRWGGRAEDAIPLYEKALEQGDDFDARLGLAYAYLHAGEKERARETGKTLEPRLPYQQKELARFHESLCGVRAPSLGAAYSYYRDSDENRVNRFTLFSGRWFGNREAAASFRLTEARGIGRRENAEELWISLRGPLGPVTVNAGAGAIKTDDAARLLARAGMDMNRGWWSVGAGAARDALTDTAELIRKRIVRTSATLSLSETASARLTFSEAYTRAGFSDGNESDDVQLGARYLVLRSPAAIAAGYRFRYWDFRRQSGGGYFDPSHFLSHQVFVSLSAEKDGWYAVLEPYVGHQSFLRSGAKTTELFAGFSGATGWRLKKCTSFELTAEGGNYAGGAAAGFNYYQAGGRVVVYF